MSSWKSLLLRIGDKCSEYSSSSEFKDHIVRNLLWSLAQRAGAFFE
ncbi:nuclear cap-binding protein subunit 1-like protein [Corchorus olitorius]|uniref:Nuclear cap-binding protein subunit 1-like protein n=1 Tax=Corchorus olitorius TaxID=93759 RepID=A0A1R3G8Q7_9ROSI|nr:nuclear cap-binding protein subunit 1-like protein [Corchorus olitorius]